MFFITATHMGEKVKKIIIIIFMDVVGNNKACKYLESLIFNNWVM